MPRLRSIGRARIRARRPRGVDGTLERVIRRLLIAGSQASPRPSKS
jgi:hypothetical protein